MKGIYCIINLYTKERYIGLSSNIIKRKAEHYNDLKNNNHYNSHLQKSYNKYGKRNFKFLIIDSNKNYTIKDLSTLEILYISKYNSYKNGYNQTLGGQLGVKGLKHTKNTKIKITINNFKNKKIKINNVIYNSISEAKRSGIKTGRNLISQYCNDPLNKMYNFL
jgi:group I intron endonuclease